MRNDILAYFLLYTYFLNLKNFKLKIKYKKINIQPKRTYTFPLSTFVQSKKILFYIVYFDLLSGKN